MFLPLSVAVTSKVTVAETVTIPIVLEARSKYGSPPFITLDMSVVATPRLRYKHCVEVRVDLDWEQRHSPEKVEVVIPLRMRFGSLQPYTGQGVVYGGGCGTRYEFYPYIGATINGSIGGSSAVLTITVTPTAKVTVTEVVTVDLSVEASSYYQVHNNAYELVTVPLTATGSSTGTPA